MTQERRKKVRLKKSLAIVHCPSKYLLQSNALSRDISEDGICLLTPHKMEIGEAVELGIYLPDAKKPVEARGEVVRRNETNDPNLPYLLGIKFTKIDATIREHILEQLRFYMPKE
jgi:c-di-GMP-binding flagellar brake protein YcgR